MMNKTAIIIAIAGAAALLLYFFSKKNTATMYNTIGNPYPVGVASIPPTYGFNPSPVSAAPRIGVQSALPSIIGAGASLAATNPYASPLRPVISQSSGVLVNNLLTSADNAFAGGPSYESAPDLLVTQPPDVPIDLTSYGSEFDATGSGGVYYA